MKKPHFKAMIGWAYQTDKETWGVQEYVLKSHPFRVRVTDARELTAEQAIAQCLRRAWIRSAMTFTKACEEVCPDGYTAFLINGNVIVRRAKR